MNKSNKVVIVFYIFFAILYGSFIFYLDDQFSDAVFGNPIIQLDEEIVLKSESGVDKIKIFNAMTDLEKYHLILPQNVVSLKIINQTNNVIYAEEEFFQTYVKSKFLVKHTMKPYESHLIEILDGDAKGTTILQIFQDTAIGTHITTTINLDFQGILAPFVHLPRHVIVDKISDTTKLFINYAKGFDDDTKKTVDDMYREILQRPADEDGFQYWGSLLESGKITKDEMRQEFLNSKEYGYLLTFDQRKTINDLDDDTKKTVDDMYREILQRPADEDGFQYWGSLLESGKITKDEMRQEFLNSYEYNTYIKANPEN